MNASATISMIHTDADPPMPLSAVGVVHDRYVFLPADGVKRALTFIELCDPARQTALCGGNEAWLRHYFPTQRRSYDMRSGACRWVSTGIDAIAAAHFLAGLCIEIETNAIREALRVSPQRPWWARLRDWLSRRFHLLLAGLRRPLTGARFAERPATDAGT